MFKKAMYGVAGLFLIGAFLYGGRVIPYAQTLVHNVRNKANESVPIKFQLKAARSQFAKIDSEIKNMVWQIAKEKAQVKKLAAQIDQQKGLLEKQKNEMLTLRNHIRSGEKVYVGTNGKAYTSERVKEDLRHRFSLYQTAEKTHAKSVEILRIRQQSLESALAQLEEAKAQQRELEIQIENLQARYRMNEVATTASKINIDNSQLSKTREMLEDIDARLSAEEEMLNLIPEYTGQIPVGDEPGMGDSNIIDELDSYFNKSDDAPQPKEGSSDNTDDDDLVQF